MLKYQLLDLMYQNTFMILEHKIKLFLYYLEEHVLLMPILNNKKKTRYNGIKNMLPHQFQNILIYIRKFH